MKKINGIWFVDKSELGKIFSEIGGAIKETSVDSPTDQDSDDKEKMKQRIKAISQNIQKRMEKYEE